MTDNVNHPPHYKTGPIEVIEVIEGWALNYNRGNAVKYILRAEHKGHTLQDLKKARWYLDREIQGLEGEHERSAGAAAQPREELP